MSGDDSGSAPSHPLAALSPRMRVVLLWSGVAVLLVLAFVAAVGAVQRAFYSPAGFATSYVQSLASKDVRAALAMPGANPTPASLVKQGLPGNPSRELLRPDVLPHLTGIRVVGDDLLASGDHLVEVAALSNGRPVTAKFTVRQTGSVLGVLPLWEFAKTPLTVARIQVQHADTFTLAGHTLEPRAAEKQPADAFSVSADYLMFAPSDYTLGHSSRYLTTTPVTFAAAAGQRVQVAVDAQPDAAFVSVVTKQLHDFLDDCAKQQVLQPAGCPFGAVIDDRVQGLPAWAIANYPDVSIQAGETGWVVPRAAGVAHLSVTVQSLFDGTVSQRETDEPFALSVSKITLRENGGIDLVVAE
ncbi:hypothetical protein GCM10027406_28190 [Leifsonia lichenia]